MINDRLRGIVVISLTCLAALAILGAWSLAILDRAPIQGFSTIAATCIGALVALLAPRNGVTHDAK